MLKPKHEMRLKGRMLSTRKAHLETGRFVRLRTQDLAVGFINDGRSVKKPDQLNHCLEYWPFLW